MRWKDICLSYDTENPERIGIWKIGQELRQGAMLLPVALLSFVFSFPTFIPFALKWCQASGTRWCINRAKNNKEKKMQ